MNRIIVVALTTTIAVSSTGTIAAADTACPVAASGWRLYPIVGTIGDPVPAPGEEPLWDVFVDAVGSEGLTVEELAESLGFEDADALYAFVLSEVLGVDANENRQVCVRPFPDENQAYPAWVHNFIDDRVRAHG